MVGAILLSGVVALAVSLTRLHGEQHRWVEFLFNRESGGGGSPLGISWLVIPFGFWFGRRLAQNGHRPESIGRSLLLPLAGILLLVGALAGVPKLIDDSRARAIAMNTGAFLCGLMAFAGWKRAYLVNLVAGMLARAPVAAIQLLAVEGAWDVHFAKGPPDAPAEDVLFILTLAQAVMWPFGFTVLVGGVFAAVGAATVERGRNAAAASP